MIATGLTVLVVDDDRDTTDSLAKLLRVRGHSPIVANNGPDAVELARQFPPDVAFLDIGLPGMDGCDVARVLVGQSCERRPLLVAISGYGQEDDYRRSQDAGFDVHFVKPVEPERLFQLLARFGQVLH